jgi:hypothetical protein
MTTKIKGYTELSQNDIDRINMIKNFEAKWNGIVDTLQLLDSVDKRDIALAKTYCEDGFSRAVRAIAKPERLVS